MPRTPFSSGAEYGPDATRRSHAASVMRADTSIFARNAANNLHKALPLRPHRAVTISSTSRRHAPSAATASAFVVSVTFSDASSSASRPSSTSPGSVIALPAYGDRAVIVPAPHRTPTHYGMRVEKARIRTRAKINTNKTNK